LIKANVLKIYSNAFAEDLKGLLKLSCGILEILDYIL